MPILVVSVYACVALAVWFVAHELGADKWNSACIAAGWPAHLCLLFILATCNLITTPVLLVLWLLKKISEHSN